MASKRKKYNARFPAGRIKRIMQTDEEVGKVAKAVPVIISRTLELFVESLLKKATSITLSRNAKTLSPSHLKQCIMAEKRFDFLRDLVTSIPDVSATEEVQSAESSPNTSRVPYPIGPNGALLLFRPPSEPYDVNYRYPDSVRQCPNVQVSSAGNPESHTRNNVYTTAPNLKRPYPASGQDGEQKQLKMLKKEPSSDAIDLRKKHDKFSQTKPLRQAANFYQETLDLPTGTEAKTSVIQPNPSPRNVQPQPIPRFLNPIPQPTFITTSHNMKLINQPSMMVTPPPQYITTPSFRAAAHNWRPAMTPLRTPAPGTSLSLRPASSSVKRNDLKPSMPPLTPLFPQKRIETVTSQNYLNSYDQVSMPITPILNIDFTKNIEKPEFKLIAPPNLGRSGTPQLPKPLERSASLDNYQTMDKSVRTNNPQSYAPRDIFWNEELFKTQR